MNAEQLSNIVPGVVAALGIEPEWMTSEPGGAGFVAAELGAWLTLIQPVGATPWLRAEVRVALDVPDGPTTRRFLDERNCRALVGRWAHDPASGAVVVAADLPASGRLLPYTVEGVAEMVCAAETVAFLSAPQRDLGGAKALTMVGGRRRDRSHPLAEHQVRNVYPAGQEPDVAEAVLCLVQDSLLYTLPAGWGFEHETRETVAGDEHGSQLLLRAACHPVAGWGLMVAVGGEQYACSEEDALVYAAALNRRDSAAGAGLAPTPGCWTYNGAGLEHRVFLTNALLDAVDGDVFAPARLVEACVRAVVSRADAGLLDRDPPAGAGPVAVRPCWPGDDEAAVAARRDPINDGIRTQDASIYLDRLSRGCAITDASLALWRSRLRPEDEPEVEGFVRWAESTSADRAARTAQPS